jgi:hypothetical protein
MYYSLSLSKTAEKINELFAKDLQLVTDRPESLFVPTLQEITKLGNDLATFQKDSLFKNRSSFKVYFEEGLKMKKEGLHLPFKKKKSKKWYAKSMIAP